MSYLKTKNYKNKGMSLGIFWVEYLSQNQEN